jgi:outer membrane receptor protein involved in Fe transport
MHNKFSSIVGFAVLQALVTLVSPQCGLRAATTNELDLPSQPLSDSLLAVGDRWNINVLFSPTQVAGITAPAITGAANAEDALARLLAGTGLIYRHIEPGTVSVMSIGASDTMMDRQSTVRDQQVSQAGSAAAPKEPAVEEIVVTGTHLRNLESITLPSLTLSRSDMQQSGYSRVEEVFAALPQNLGELSSAASTSPGISSLASSNSEGATAISLRGLGAESTLVLLDGKRRPGSVNGRAVDISAIPLSLVERIDIVTDGRSAIYGSDAVAGVVNVITRSDFDGAETAGYYGATSRDDAGRTGVSQLFGHRFDDGNVMFAYDFGRDVALDALDTGLVQSPSESGIELQRMDIRPQSTRHSAYVSANRQVTGPLRLHADALYSSIDRARSINWTLPGLFDYFESSENSGQQLSASTSATVDLGHDWDIEVSGVYGSVHNRAVGISAFGPLGDDIRTTSSSVGAVLTGSLRGWGGRQMQTAVGAEGRREAYRRVALLTSTRAEDRDRLIHSVFAELMIPVLDAPAPDSPRRLDVLLAARSDHYDDFGDTFNPQVSLLWKAANALTFRAAYSTAFRAPALFDLDVASNATLSLVSDPVSGTAVPLLVAGGGNPDLKPEEATTWSVGFACSLEWLSSATLSATYFDIDYERRIDTPALVTTDVLVNQARYPGLINRAPDAARLAQILAGGQFTDQTGSGFDPASEAILEVFPNVVVFDNRSQNIGVEHLRGIDLSLDGALRTSLGDLSYGMNGTYLLQLDRRVTATSPVFVQLNTPGKPVDFRVRGRLGLMRSAFGVFAYVNYTDDYKDIAPSFRAIDSWTTVDVSIRFDGTRLALGRPFEGVSMSFSVENLLDAEAPRYLGNGLGLGFDGANASPVGRYLTVNVQKTW